MLGPLRQISRKMTGRISASTGELNSSVLKVKEQICCGSTSNSNNSTSSNLQNGNGRGSVGTSKTDCNYEVSPVNQVLV